MYCEFVFMCMVCYFVVCYLLAAIIFIFPLMQANRTAVSETYLD